MIYEGKWPEYTPVMHLIEKYKGWIHSTTKMKELFTGSKDCEWQYTVRVKHSEKMKIANPMELERIKVGAEFPPIPAKDYQFGNHPASPFIELAEETQLHALGYQISGMNDVERWSVLNNVAIPILGIEAVVRTIIAVAGLRACNEKMADRHRYALLEWYKDLRMILDRFGEGEELKDTWLRESAERFFDTLKIYKIIDGDPRLPQIEL